MADLREVFEMVTKQIEPDQDSWKEQQQRRDRSARNRKMRAMAVAAAITTGVALFAAGVLNRGDDGSTPATVTPSASGVALTVVGLDGSIRSTVANLPEGAAMPDISPDGTRVAFTISDEQEGRFSQIAVMRLDGTGLHTVTNLSNSSGEWPRWTPDGTRLLFYRLLSYRSQQTNGLGFRRLVLMNADGTDARLIRGTESPDSQPPDWSPDGTMILYTSIAGDQQLLATVPVTGGRSHPLTAPRLEGGDGTWSPDGESIAFTRAVGSFFEVWLMNADGSERHLLAALPGANAQAPEWSPDGSMIAFIGSAFGIGGVGSTSDAVYVMDVATGEITEVLRGSAVGFGRDNRATWLPEGDALLVMTETP